MIPHKLASVEIDGKSAVAVSNGDDTWQLIEPDRACPWLRSVMSVIRNLGAIDWDRLPNPGPIVPTRQLRFLSPLRRMEKIICVGKNYVEHAREMGGEAPELPVIFSKFASSIIGPGDNIVLPSISDQVDFEAELVVVIGKQGRFIDRDQAMDHVVGYTIGNDVSARDWQKGRPGGQWLLGKTFDTFAPIGPWIALRNSIPDPHCLDIELKLNDVTMQRGNTSGFIFRIDQLVAHVSQFFTLKPGDLIFTGTPAGVGAGRIPPFFLKAGDAIEISIEGIGTLANDVVAESKS